MKLLKVLKDSELPTIVSEPVLELTREVKEFCIDLSMTMRYNSGIGISAPQVGVLKRIIVIDVISDKIGDRINYIMINPEILERHGKQQLNEGCLSFPKQYVRTERDATITVKWTNTAGETMEEVFHGLPAAVVEHEIDHLEGITMYQRKI